MSDTAPPGPDPSAALLGGDVPDGCMELAVALADAATAVVTRHFRRDVRVEHKADQSPVTVADQEAEFEIRRLIGETFPDHGIFGEEHGHEALDARYVWVIDPIDGTKSFITGKPLFGTLIALCEDGVPILGIIEMQALGERFVGARGRPTTQNGRPVETRRCAALERAWVYATSPYMFAPGAEAEAFERLRSSTLETVFGGDCYAYGLLASGTVDVICEAGMHPYDYMALVPVVEGAGGRISDWSGAPLRFEGAGAKTVLAAGDPDRHAEALGILAG